MRSAAVCRSRPIAFVMGEDPLPLPCSQTSLPFAPCTTRFKTRRPKMTIQSPENNDTLILILACLTALAFVVATPIHAEAQVPAFLPRVQDVAPSESLPIDGVWRISTIGKRIRIDDGRAYAVDPWLHLLVLHVQPEMVVIQNIRRTGPGRYGGDDLPLMGKLTATLDASGTLNVNVAGALAPVRYRLIPVEMEDDAELKRELALGDDSGDAGRQPAPPVFKPPSAPPSRAAPPRAKPTPNDPTPGCGGEGQSPCTVVIPRPEGEAKKLGCPGRNLYFSTLRGGSCWSCPDGYKRTLRKMDHDRACKKRKSITGPWTRATYRSRAWGCPPGQFHVGAPTGGHCFSCPKGYKRVHIAGMDRMQCRPVEKCDGRLRVAKRPPTKDVFASLFGTTKAEVCAPPFDIAAAAKRDLPKFAGVRFFAQSLIGDLLADKDRRRALKKALKDDDRQRALEILNQLPSFLNLRNAAQENAYAALSIGWGSDVQIGVGGAAEVGIAVDLNNMALVGYESVSLTKGLSVGIDTGITVGVWTLPFETGYSQGFTASVSGTVSGGAGVWYSYYDPQQGQERLAGLTLTGGIGLGAEIGEYNEVGTRIIR